MKIIAIAPRTILLVLTAIVLPSAAHSDDRIERVDRAVVTKTMTGTCLATFPDGLTKEFQDEQSLGSILQASNPCQNPDNFPCYCSTTEPDGVRCPYCSFPQATDETRHRDGDSCVQVGGTIIFTSKSDVRLQCGCEYLDGDQPQSECAPFVEMVPPSDENPGDRVPFPTDPQPTCSGFNTENCAALVANQTQVAGCSSDACYNYCDDVFAGCCEPGAIGCNTSCKSNDHLPALTLGCRLPTNNADTPPIVVDVPDRSCTFATNKCNDSSDCCSVLCLRGVCARKDRVTDASRQKMSAGTRGGAAGGGAGGIVVTTNGGGRRRRLTSAVHEKHGFPIVAEHGRIRGV